MAKVSLMAKRVSCLVVVAMITISLNHYFKFFQATLLEESLLGSAIGIVLALLLFPRKIVTDFRLNMIAVLRAYSEYLSAIASLFLHEKPAADAEQQKMRVEKLLCSSSFPDWVYRKGFSDFFRHGHRHFLIRIEQVGQILFAMHYAARHTLAIELLERFRAALEQTLFQTQELFVVLLSRLELKVQPQELPDLIEDMVALEKTFHEVVAVPLELVDTSQDYLSLAAFIYDLKDMRKMLLKLAESLRDTR